MAAVVRNGANFLSAAWCREAFHGLGVWDVESLILVDVLFPLNGERTREGKKKITMGEKDFPRTGPTLLAVSQVAAVGCN
jgi:hypothetical protein